MEPLAPLEDLPLPALLETLVPTVDLAGVVGRALREDLGASGDVTSATMIAPASACHAVVRTRAAGVVCGVPVALETLRQAAPQVRITQHMQDGERAEPGATILSMHGPQQQVLAAERTLLNFLGMLSGVATLTAQYVAAVQGTRAVICATRKTTPGLRALQKYAVRCGGGNLHRMGLYDAMLVKDNHVAGLGPAEMAAAAARAAAEARQRWPLRFVMVECDTMEQFQSLLGLPASAVDIALLDNMTTEQLAEAVNLRDHLGSPVRIEASGGVNLQTVRQIAATGVDRISVGALTHSAPSLDVGLDLELADA